jgi:hypothetical protein
LGQLRSGIFLQGGLDDQNQLDPAQQIRFYAQAVTTAQPSSSLRKHCESTDDVLLTKNGYLLALRFFAVFRFFAAFFGTFAPPRLASDRAIAIACLRLLTLRRSGRFSACRPCALSSRARLWRKPFLNIFVP